MLNFFLKKGTSNLELISLNTQAHFFYLSLFKICFLHMEVYQKRMVSEIKM